ncbi:hypothetical protein [Streptacidiphilus albus]|uniref:hypothetical protein n=1 Tax=Streptacidiphilus albus TaxID=105425 RepID=UPI00054C4DD8|nr:hypothetical protein [Streptacidiphilus albus]
MTNRPTTRTQRLLRLVTTAQTRPLTAAESLTLGRVINWTTTELNRTRTANDTARDALLDLLGIVDQWERGHSTELGRTAVCEIISRTAHKGLNISVEPTATTTAPACSSGTEGRSGTPFTAQQAAAINAAGLPTRTLLTMDIASFIFNNLCGDQGGNAPSDGINVTCIKLRGHDWHDQPTELDDDPWHTDGHGRTWRNSEAEAQDASEQGEPEAGHTDRLQTLAAALRLLTAHDLAAILASGAFIGGGTVTAEDIDRITTNTCGNNPPHDAQIRCVWPSGHRNEHSDYEGRVW